MTTSREVDDDYCLRSPRARTPNLTGRKEGDEDIEMTDDVRDKVEDRVQPRKT